MNLKKILSLALASTMLFSVVSVSAMDIEYEMDGSDVIITTEYAESAATSSNGATVNAVAEKKTSVDDEVNALGRTWKKYIENATNDVYKITYTVTDFGMFANGYDDVDTSYFALYDVTVAYDLGDAKIANAVVPSAANVASVATLGSTLPDGTAIVPSFGKNDTAGVLTLYFQPSASNTAGQVWPTPNTVINDGKFTFVVFIAVDPGASFTLKATDNSSFKKMNYAVGSSQYGITAGIWTNTNITMSDLVVGATEPTPDPEPEVPTKATKYAKLVAGDGSYVVIDLINGETIKDTAKLFLPAGVKGGEANVGIKFMFTAGVAAAGKVAPAVGDVFKLYHVKDSNADAKTEIATFDVE